MSTETEVNIAIVREWVNDVWNAGDLDHLAHFHPASFENHGRRMSLDETRHWHLSNRATFPDVCYTIDDLFAVDDRVAMRWTAQATHAGALWNLIPPTGRSISWSGMHLLRLADKRIVEVWAVQDTVAQLRQMGVTLQPATAAR